MFLVTPGILGTRECKLYTVIRELRTKKNKNCCRSLSNKQLPRVGIELAAYGLLEKRLDLSPKSCAVSLNPGVIEALHSSRYTTPPKSSRLEDFVKRGL